MLDALLVIGLVLFLLGFPLLMFYGLRQMIRDKNRTGGFTSGLGGAVSEVERVVRPSIEHVIEAQNSVKQHDDHIGGE